MVTLKTECASPLRSTAEVIAFLIFEDKNIRRRQLQELTKQFHSLPPASREFSGKESETLLLHPVELGSRRLLLVGIGTREELSLERLRRAAAKAATTARSARATSVAVVEPDPQTLSSHELSSSWHAMATALAEGAALSLYTFDKYLTDERKKEPRLTLVVILSEEKDRARLMAHGVNHARILCEATCLARDLANAPGNEIYPQSLAARARQVARRNGLSIAVFDEKKLRRLTMGGLLGVAQGSGRPPRFIIMQHNPRKRNLPTIVLVGKGVTFDSGGISLKPSANMAEMKMDMSGAAAVVGTMQAAARLKLPLRLVGLIPAAENLPSGTALKPGDIITHFNGKTSECDNTDAEGRLILADALSYASRYEPDLVIDLATLTGAVVVALGHVATGMLGNDENAMAQLKAAGEHTYERVWQLPMFKEYERLVKSDIADVKNVGGRWAGAITGAMFLQKFIGNYKWVHLDIAGTAILEEAQDYIPKGGSGVGVRLLLEFLRHWHRRGSRDNQKDPA